MPAIVLSTLRLTQSLDTMIEERLEIGSEAENVQKSDGGGPCRNICSLLSQMKEFCVEKNIEKDEEIHVDSDKFNAAIKKSNEEGNHNEIYDLLGPRSSLSILITKF